MIRRCPHCGKEVLHDELRCAHCKELVRRSSFSWGLVRLILTIIAVITIYCYRAPIFDWIVYHFLAILPFLFILYIIYWVMDKCTFGLFGRIIRSIFGGK